MRQAISSVLVAIHQKAPDAKILLMGYPHIMEDAGDCRTFFNLSSNSNIPWFNAMGDQLATAMQGAVTDALASPNMSGAGVVFANPIAEFSGHGACANVGAQGVAEYINGRVNFHSDGEDPNTGTSQQSFHPNLTGTDHYALVARARMTSAAWGV